LLAGGKRGHCRRKSGGDPGGGGRRKCRSAGPSATTCMPPAAVSSLDSIVSGKCPLGRRANLNRRPRPTVVAGSAFAQRRAGGNFNGQYPLSTCRLSGGSGGASTAEGARATAEVRAEATGHRPRMPLFRATTDLSRSSARRRCPETAVIREGGGGGVRVSRAGPPGPLFRGNAKPTGCHDAVCAASARSSGTRGVVRRGGPVRACWLPRFRERTRRPSSAPHKPLQSLGLGLAIPGLPFAVFVALVLLVTIIRHPLALLLECPAVTCGAVSWAGSRRAIWYSSRSADSRALRPRAACDAWLGSCLGAAGGPRGSLVAAEADSRWAGRPDRASVRAAGWHRRAGPGATWSGRSVAAAMSYWPHLMAGR